MLAQSKLDVEWSVLPMDSHEFLGLEVGTGVVILVSEFEPALLPNGMKRRLEHLADWLVGLNQLYEIQVINGIHASRIRRFHNSVIFFRKIAATHDSNRIPVFLVNGLASPHLFFSTLLIVSKHKVIFDVCDSLKSQFYDNLKKMNVLRIFMLLTMLLTVKFSRNSMKYSFITRNDVMNDSFFLKRRITFPIYPCLPRGIPKIGESINGLVDNVVLFNSDAAPHTKRFTELFFREIDSLVLARPDLRIDLYGSKTFKNEISSNVQIHTEWISLEQIYQGPFLVFIPNETRSGVPNKLIEAVCLQRPIVLHSSLAAQLEEHPLVISFTSKRDLGRCLVTAVTNMWNIDPTNRIRFKDANLNLLFTND